MSSKILCLVTLLAYTLKLTFTQESCRGRCGAEYYRGHMCQCDYSCLSYGECCSDYESQCTSKHSCKGRCGENFKRGRRCTCDSDCFKFGQCCPDYKAHCEADEKRGAATGPMKSNSCDNVHNNNPKDSTLTDDPSLGEGNNADDNSFTPDSSATPYPLNDLSDDIFGEIFPLDDPSTNGDGDPEASPGPEIISGEGSNPAEPLDKIPTEATLVTGDPAFSTETPEVSPADLIFTPTTPSKDLQDPNGDPDGPTIAPDPTAAADDDILQPFSPSASTVSIDTEEEILSSETPEVLSTDMQDLIAEPEKSQLGSTPASSILASAMPPEENTSNPNIESDPGSSTSSPDVLQGIKDPESTLSPDGNGVSSSTDADPHETTDSDQPDVPTADAPTSEPDIQPLNPLTQSTDSDQPDVPTADPPTSEPDIQPLNPLTQSTDSDQPDVPTADPPTSEPDITTLNPQTQSTDSDQPDVPTADPPTSEPDITTLNPQTQSTDSNQPDILTPDPPTSETDIKPLNPQTQSTDTDQPDVPVTDSPTPEPNITPDPSKVSTTSKPNTKPLNPQTQKPYNPRDYQGDENSDSDLCSGRPVGGVTTLRNGTIVVFRGHYFWFLDRNRVPSPPRGITEVWGVPSPIDTVFTRCNCQGKTYIFKGGKYWRFENDALDSGYPKAIKVGFDGLQGHITAALSVPQYLNRKESVFFFKRGGTVQKYSYQFGTSSGCRRTSSLPVYTVRSRFARQAVSVLEPAVNIRKAWRGFPSTITAAVSLPSSRDPEGYRYVVFSRSTAFNVRMQGERPVVAAPSPNVSPRTNNFFKCPRKL
ncbi:proteoglycan 4b isoform X1 [Cyprinodon tularosa]|uniref:proteoglycan 4b isoform X1 n=1 Tax=Cyprinodon tularosa TaxID=77115 RepID=UPI0018E234D8|nr:proteoglycan 4b isoform X1 [Cyprinodon tularosa]